MNLPIILFIIGILGFSKNVEYNSVLVLRGTKVKKKYIRWKWIIY